MDSKSKDRISELPDAIVCHILSFLSTKYAVRTSILSTRWKNTWAAVPNLDFNERDYSSSAGFLEFVDRVLFFRDSSDIQKFRLHFSHVKDSSHIYGWICTAIRSNAVELDLFVPSNADKMFELPKRLFTCKTLMVLKLTTNFITNVPTSGCFPSLKVLHVICEYGADKDSIEKFFSHFPVLEDLNIDGYLEDDVFNFKFSMPELKTIRLRLATSDHFPATFNFFLDAPKLEKIDLKENVMSNFILENLKSLVEANIHLRYHYEADEEDAFATFLAGISNVKYLFLSTHVFEGSWPAFNNLSKVTLVLHTCCSWWKMLINLLERSPTLECLVLKHANDPGPNCKNKGCLVIEFEESRFTWQEGCFKREWSPPESVPICLSRLKTFSIKGFWGHLDEIEVAKYLLKNGEVLKKMTISKGYCRRPKEELYKEFSMFERGSKTCEIEIL